MTWGLTILIALLTSAAGAGAAGCLASLCVDWYRMSSREGASGYFVISIALLGLIGGLLIGAITSRVVNSGFWIAQGYSLAIVVGTCFIIGFVARLGGEVPPELDGQELMLDVELRCPRQWRPDNATRSTNTCSLQPLNKSSGTLGQHFSGSLEWNEASQVDGQWIARGHVTLGSSRPDRYVRIILGHVTDVSFLLPLPPSPRREHLQWTPWSNQYFSQPVGQPPVTSYEYRVRVRPVSEWRNTRDAALEAVSVENAKRVAAIPDGAPIENWLPFFEFESTGIPAADRAAVAERVHTTIASRATDLAAPLLSNDHHSVLRAVYAAATLDVVPKELIAPLAKAGLLTVKLIHQAQANAHPNDPDLEGEKVALAFFFKWYLAAELAGPASAQGRLSALKEIQREISAGQTGDLATLGSYAGQYIEKLSVP